MNKVLLNQMCLAVLSGFSQVSLTSVYCSHKLERKKKLSKRYGTHEKIKLIKKSNENLPVCSQLTPQNTVLSICLIKVTPGNGSARFSLQM